MIRKILLTLPFTLSLTAFSEEASPLKEVVNLTKGIPSQGKLSGFKIPKVPDGSLYAKMGLKEGDIIKEVNGVPLAGVSQAIKTLVSLREASKIHLLVERNGKPMDINISLEEEASH